VAVNDNDDPGETFEAAEELARKIKNRFENGNR
jgi:hypothetical protein